MGLEFLERVRTSSMWAGGTVALVVATYRSLEDGLAVALGAGWSLLNLALIQRLVVALTGPERGTRKGLARAGLALGGMAGLFAAGAALLIALPPASLVWGFLAPFAVIVLKAASLLLLGSTTWTRLTGRRGAGTRGSAGAGAGRSGDPRRLSGLLLLLLLAAAAAPFVAGAASQDPHGADDHAAAPGPQKFANFITILSRAFPEAGWAHFLHEFEVVIFALLVAFLLGLVAFLASRNPKMIPGKLQNAVEYVVEALHDFVVGILGPRHGPRYVPFLGTLFVYILAMNWFGLIPFLESPTSSLNVTVALAVTVFLYAQYIGFRELGLIGYLDHMAGNPRTLIQWLLVPLMLPIHVLGEFAKPISLAARLFGNIFGEDMLLVAFVTLGVTTLAFTGIPLGLPLQFPFLLLALLTSTLQALVFTVLSTIYFLLMLPHDDHEHSEARTAH